MIPWTDSIRQSGKLTIYAGGLGGSWAHVFKEVLHAVNTLSSAHRLGVVFAESKDAPKEDGGGANVSIRTADGSVSGSYGGASQTEDFSGNRLHGRTLQFSREGRMEKAFIYLPSQPKVNTPKGMRAAGAGVMKVIAAHELLHACGLEDSDHSTDDLFQGNPRVNAGDTAAGDKILIGMGPKEMPPLVLGGATAKKIKDLWAK